MPRLRVQIGSRFRMQLKVCQQNRRSWECSRRIPSRSGWIIANRSVFGKSSKATAVCSVVMPYLARKLNRQFVPVPTATRDQPARRSQSDVLVQRRIQKGTGDGVGHKKDKKLNTRGDCGQTIHHRSICFVNGVAVVTGLTDILHHFPDDNSTPYRSQRLNDVHDHQDYGGRAVAAIPLSNNRRGSVLVQSGVALCFRHQSKQHLYAANPGCSWPTRSVLDCASPLALSSGDPNPLRLEVILDEVSRVAAQSGLIDGIPLGFGSVNSVRF